jgi:hypothetical protein
LEASVMNALPETAPLRRWTIRVPEEVAREVEDLARSKRISVNALLSFALDKTLADSGRRSIADLAPWFEFYLLRGVGGGRDADPAGSREQDEFA